MKALNILIMSTLLSLIAVSCGPKTIEKHIVAENAATAPQGGETHGGDVLRARALNYKEVILKGRVALDKAFSGPYGAQYSWAETRQAVKSFMLALSIIAQRTKNQEIKKLLGVLVGREAEIIRDVEESLYNVKIYPPADTPDATGPEYDVCRDYHGNVSTAGAKLGDLGGEICIDAKKLAVENPTGAELVSLIVHEHLHHLGFEEAKSVEVQRFLTSKSLNMVRYVSDYQTDDAFIGVDIDINNLPASVRMTGVEGLKFLEDRDALDGKSFRSLGGTDVYCGIFVGENCLPYFPTKLADISAEAENTRVFKFDEYVKVMPGAVINLPEFGYFENDGKIEERNGMLKVEFLNAEGEVIVSFETKIGVQNNRKAGILFY